jgi:hypothetical protein
MNIYKARIKEPNTIGNNYGIETGNYSDPICVPVVASSTYKVGDEVLCIDIDDTPIILGVIPQEYTKTNDEGRQEVSGVTLSTKTTPSSKFILDSKFQKVGEHSNAGLSRPESLPGDNILKGGSNNGLKLLGGGVNILDSETAKVITNRNTASVDIDCSEFSLSTGMGELSISPGTNGAFSLDFKGNTSPGELNPNTSPSGEPIYNISASLGDTLEIISGSGFGIKINASGKVSLLGNSLYLQQGDRETPIAGTDNDIEEVFSKIISHVAENKHSITSEGDIENTCSGDYTINVGKNSKEIVSGPTSLSNLEVLLNPAGVFSKEEVILNGGFKCTVGSPLSGGGKHKVIAHGDIHLAGGSHATGGASIVLDPSYLPNTISNGAWSSVNTSRYSLNTMLPSNPIDGLPHPWAFVVPVPGGANPSNTGYVKYSQYALAMNGVLSTLQLALAACSTAPGLTPPAILAINNAVAACALSQLSLPLHETKSHYINELPV